MSGPNAPPSAARPARLARRTTDGAEISPAFAVLEAPDFVQQASQGRLLESKTRPKGTVQNRRPGAALVPSAHSPATSRRVLKPLQGTASRRSIDGGPVRMPGCLVAWGGAGANQHTATCPGEPLPQSCSGTTAASSLPQLAIHCISYSPCTYAMGGHVAAGQRGGLRTRTQSHPGKLPPAPMRPVRCSGEGGDAGSSSNTWTSGAADVDPVQLGGEVSGPAEAHGFGGSGDSLTRPGPQRRESAPEMDQEVLVVQHQVQPAEGPADSTVGATLAQPQTASRPQTISSTETQPLTSASASPSALTLHLAIADGKKPAVTGQRGVGSAARRKQQLRISQLAVSLSWLRSFAKEHGIADRGLSTLQVVQEIIVPKSEARKCRFTQLLLPQPSPTAVASGTRQSTARGPLTGQRQTRGWVSRGRPFYFVSHAWCRPFMETLRMLESHFSREQQTRWRRGKHGVTLPPLAPENTFVWLDIFAINQHPDSGQQEQDLQALTDVIADSEGVLMVLDAEGAAVLGRAWCLWEAWQSGRRGKPLTLLSYGVPYSQLELVFMEMDVHKAKATVEEDRTRILADIEHSPGGMEAMTRQLKKSLVDGLAAIESAVEFARHLLQQKKLEEAEMFCYHALDRLATDMESRRAAMYILMDIYSKMDRKQEYADLCMSWGMAMGIAS